MTDSPGNLSLSGHCFDSADKNPRSSAVKHARTRREPRSYGPSSTREYIDPTRFRGCETSVITIFIIKENLLPSTEEPPYLESFKLDPRDLCLRICDPLVFRLVILCSSFSFSFFALFIPLFLLRCWQACFEKLVRVSSRWVGIE